MPALPINFACSLYDRMLALYTGDVKPDGIDLNFVVLDNPREIFDRMTGRLEFDVCEMSSSVALPPRSCLSWRCRSSRPGSFVTALSS